MKCWNSISENVQNSLLNIKLQHDKIPDLIPDGVGWDDVVQMGDVFGMISGNVLEADEESDCFLYVI